MFKYCVFIQWKTKEHRTKYNILYACNLLICFGRTQFLLKEINFSIEHDKFTYMF